MSDGAGLFRKDILAASAYRVRHDPRAVKLSQNESPWDLPLEIKVAIAEKLIKSDFNRYPLEEPLTLKKKLARLNNVLTDQVLLANGSNVLIQALTHATSLKARGKVLVPDPTFGVYELQARLFGIPVVKVPLGENFVLSPEAVIAAVRRENPSLVFIANPNAPTGNLFARDALYRIVKAASCLTVIDEAYHPFSNETVAEWIADFPHLMVLRTMSKAWGLAGIRVGYALADTEVVVQLEKALMPYRLSRTACIIASEAVDHHDYVARYVRDVLKLRRRLFDEMRKLPALTVFPSETNFLLFRVAGARRLADELARRGVMVRDVGDDGALKDCLRVTVGTEKENETFLKALKAALGKAMS